ncbi:MAG: C39 family peptidase [Chthoniobacteraceae bacterium]
MPSRSAKPRILLGALVLLALAVAGAWWAWPQKALPSRGGLYLPWSLELAVPSFRQGDSRWGKEPLGDTVGTLSGEGCAVTSAAMVLAAYGVDTDPGRLNGYLTRNGGYVGQGWLVWEKAAEFTPGRCEKAYENDASFARIDWNLLRGNPVIVRVRFPGGPTHFVVIAGKRGWDYLIRDPGRGAERGLYPLADLSPNVEALRYYRRL